MPPATPRPHRSAAPPHGPGFRAHAASIAAMQRRWATRLLAAAGLLAALAAAAHSVTSGALTIGHPFARETPPGARTGGAYFTVVNAGKEADTLTAVASPAAARASLHTMTMDGTMMKMRSIASLPVPAGGTLTLAPGGYHVMLEDLAKPLVKGDRIPLRLTFEKAGAVDVVVNVESITAAHPH